MISIPEMVRRRISEFHKRFDMSDDDSRRIVMFRVLMYSALSFLFLLGTYSFLEGETLLALVDGVLIIILALILGLSGRAISLNKGINFTSVLYLVFLYYLFYTGSARNQTFLWYYSFPVVFCFLMGRKKGIILSMGLWFLTFLTHILRGFLPLFSTYPEGLVLRILASYLFVVFLMYIYEYSRESTSRKLESTIGELHEKAVRDGLTGLYNRRYLDEIWHILGRQQGKEDKYIAFLMLDIDFFKLYNDHYGHQKGDDALKYIAKMLKGQIRRSSDYVFRYGGEEFAVLYYGITPEMTKTLTKKLVEETCNLAIPHQKSPFGKVTLSAGCCLVPLSLPLDPEAITKTADDALYSAKEKGRNQFEIREKS